VTEEKRAASAYLGGDSRPFVRDSGLLGGPETESPGPASTPPVIGRRTWPGGRVVPLPPFSIPVLFYAGARRHRGILFILGPPLIGGFGGRDPRAWRKAALLSVPDIDERAR